MVVDLNMKWNGYKEGRLCLWNGSELYIATPEYDDSIIDYDDDDYEENCWIVDVYGVDDNIIQGGCWTEEKPIKEIDYTIQGVIDRLGECDLWADNWKFVPKEEAYEFMDLIEDYWSANRKKNAKLISAARQEVNRQAKVLDKLVENDPAIPQ